MKDRAPAIDAHAYVDKCLNAEERKAFEARLRQDQDLRRRVELWQAQSEAICSAFGAPGRGARPSGPRAAPTPSSPHPAAIRGEPVERSLRSMARTRTAERAAPKWTSFLRRPATRAAFVLLGIALFPAAMTRAPEAALGQTGALAFRTFAPASPSTLDFRGGDNAELARTLGPSFLAVGLAQWLTPLGWTLRGAKRVPGLQGEAALILLEGEEERPLGILVEPLDAPAASAIHMESRGGMKVAAFTRRGFGFAVAAQAEEDVEAWLSAAGFADEGWPQPAR